MKKAVAAVVAVVVSATGLGWIALAVLFTLFNQAAVAAANPCQQPLGGQLAVGDGTVRLPLVGPFTVTSEYGMRRHPITGVWALHGGLDLASSIPTPTVVAALTGSVVSTPTEPSGGNMIILDHGAGVHTEYLHLASRLVTPGQHVAIGQPIAIEGTTGSSTGVHLHFNVRVNGLLVNPRDWLTAHQVHVPALGSSGVGPPAGGVSAGPQPPGTPIEATGSAGLPARVGEYAGEQVRIAALIVKAGKDRGLDDWSTTVAVMAGMGESSLRNLDHGDAVRNDTVGVFQEGPERGPLSSRMDPYAAAGIFFDYLTRIPDYHSLAPTIAAHRAQANADPYHYEPFWPAAAQMVATLTANPALLATLQASGGSAACQPAGNLPAPPAAGTCPATGLPAEVGLQPAALTVLRCVKAAFPELTTIYGVGERSGGGDHPIGRAVDFMIDTYRTPEGNALGWRVAQWVRANAHALGVTYVIFDMKIWSVERDTEGWRPYTRYGDTPDDTLSHRDHVHVSA